MEPSWRHRLALTANCKSDGPVTPRRWNSGFTQEEKGGARALALEPVQESASWGALSRQTIPLTGRQGAAHAAGLGVLNAAAPVLKAQQIRQLASWVCCWLPSSPGAGEWLRQISAVASGSEATAAKAKLAPIGARICTISAITKIGTYRVSRRILKNPFGSIKHQRYHKSRSPDSAAARWSTEINAGDVSLFRKQPDFCDLAQSVHDRHTPYRRHPRLPKRQVPAAFMAWSGITRPAKPEAGGPGLPDHPGRTNFDREGRFDAAMGGRASPPAGTRTAGGPGLASINY